MTACAGCQYWAMHDPDTSHGGGERAGDEFADWGNCRRQTDGPSPTPIWSQDSSDYSSWIVTRRDFSCSEWMQKAPA